MSVWDRKEAARVVNFDKLGSRQMEALRNVAFGGHGHGIGRRLLSALVAKGLIETVERHSRDRLGDFSWTEYEMPLPVHIDFCAWCERTENETREAL